MIAVTKKKYTISEALSKVRVAGEELEMKDELRVFCVLRNSKKGTWRLVQSDSVFSATVFPEMEFKAVLEYMASQNEKHSGKKIEIR